MRTAAKRSLNLGEQQDRRQRTEHAASGCELDLVTHIASLHGHGKYKHSCLNLPYSETTCVH
jgi:hypothetical protein